MNATAVYPVHVNRLNFTKKFCLYPIDHGHTFAGLLSVSTATDVEVVEVIDGVIEETTKKFLCRTNYYELMTEMGEMLGSTFCILPQIRYCLHLPCIKRVDLKLA